jgi:hypothetical protein
LGIFSVDPFVALQHDGFRRRIASSQVKLCGAIKYSWAHSSQPGEQDHATPSPESLQKKALAPRNRSKDQYLRRPAHCKFAGFPGPDAWWNFLVGSSTTPKAGTKIIP